jgi:tetratricopeptide (TPR) repeat protein
MAIEHPTRKDLDRLLTGELPTPAVRAVLAHLITGCHKCRLAVARRAPFLDDRWMAHGDPPEPLSPAADASYDLALTRAIEGVLLHGDRVLEHKAQTRRFRSLLRQGANPESLAAAPGLQLPLFEALLDRSWELRTEDPVEMVRLAQAAARLARDLGSDGYTPRQVADFTARAGGALGNALRIAERLQEAEQTLRRALETWAFGSRDSGLRARLLDFTASLFGMQRRNREAAAVLAVVHSLYLRRGDRHNAGRALISRSTYSGAGGQWQEALALLRQGLSMLDPERDPELRTLALHNQISFLADGGRFEEAWALLQRDRKQLKACGSRLVQAKVDWIEGRVLAGRGQAEAATLALGRARRDLEQVGLEIGAARVAVDLAAVWMQQGRRSEARQAAVQAVETFLAHGIEGEGLAAVLALREAFEAEFAPAVLVQRIGDFLRRLELDPTAHFG